MTRYLPAKHAPVAASLLPAAMILLARTGTAFAAGNTSCDIVTGASCLWKEGCDCDHDGYVIESGKAAKYCHFDRCPIDMNDKDAKVLGKSSTYNADGDGWTKKYDCDDNDKCVGKTCGQSTCAAADPDGDKDGFPASKDCNDKDPLVKPGAADACCDCANITNAAKYAALGCAGCPTVVPDPDAGSPDAGGPGGAPDDAGGGPDEGIAEEDTSSFDFAPLDGSAGGDAGASDGVGPGAGTDVAAASDGGLGLADAGSGGGPGEDPSGGSTLTEPGVGGFVGGGTLDHGTPPPPGCAASAPEGGERVGAALGLLAFALLFSVLRRRRGALVCCALICLGATGGACVSVQPWQRQTLAHRCMILGRNAGEQTLEQHTFQYREGAAGGFGGGGGGCGCN